MRFRKDGFDKPRFCKAGKIGAKVRVEVKGKRKREEDLRCERKREGAKKRNAGGKEGERGGCSGVGQRRGKGKGRGPGRGGQNEEEVKQSREARFRARRSIEGKNRGGGVRGV